MSTASTTSPVLAVNANPRPANFTRQTTDLVTKFKQKGQWHLIPLYHFIRLSDFGREGIERSGSYKFADHLYRNTASGHGLIGRVLDRILLNMPAAQAMRRRYLHIIDQLELALHNRTAPLRMLALPCGLPRDVSELMQKHPHFAAKLDYVGMDIDPEVVNAAGDFLKGTTLKSKQLMQGDALNIKTYPTGSFDIIASTGLGEFLNDVQVRQFYRNVFDSLNEGGTFCTSTTAREKRSDYLLQAFELQTNYRTTGETHKLLDELPWRHVSLTQDVTGLQTFVTATR